MTSPFHRPYRTAEQIAEHKAQRLAEAVSRRLEGTPEPKVPAYQGNTSKDLAKHRELEIEILTDLGYGDPEAIRLMKHHAREAESRAESYARNWSRNTERGGPGGWNNLPKHVKAMIEGLRDRIDPALKVAEAEFDPEGLLRRAYDEIEAAHLDRVEAIKIENEQLRRDAGSYRRSKIRQEEIKDLQDVLDSMAADVGDWQVQLIDASQVVEESGQPF